ncbi:MAG: alpha/beta hydrolase family protein [Planctomycetota bacterium]|jgi:hypothetical protein
MNHHASHIAFLALAMLASPVTADPVTETDKLTALVQSYVSQDVGKARQKILRSIVQETGSDLGRLADSLRRLQLWREPDAKSGGFLVAGPTSRLRVSFYLPDNYDPINAHPLVIQYAQRGSDSSELAAAMQSVAPGTVFAALTAPPSTGTSAAVASAAALSDAGVMDAALVEIAQRFHIDRDRVFLWIDGRSSTVGWLAAIGRPDLLAGVLATVPPMELPYPNQHYPLVARNLSHLPVMLLNSEIGQDSDYHLAWHAALRGQGVSITTIDTQPGDSSSAMISAARDGLAEFMGLRRSHATRNETRLFRLPDMAQTARLRLTSMRGEPWIEGTVSIKPAPGTDGNEFATRVLERLHGELSLEVRGNEWHLQTRRCKRLDILWPLEVVQSGRKVTVFCNGKKRFDDTVKPDAAVLLNHALATWDFARPVGALTSLTIREDSQP